MEKKKKIKKNLMEKPHAKWCKIVFFFQMLLDKSTNQIVFQASRLMISKIRN